MVALSDLIVPQSASSIITTQLALLQLAGFPVNSWQSGSVPLSLIQADASTLASLSQTISNIASGGLLSLATGGYLDLIAGSHYGLTRKPAVGTIGTMALTDAQSAGPFTITIGQLVAASGNLLFSNTTGGTLNRGSTLSLVWACQTPGQSIGQNLTTPTPLTLVTPLPGVTVTNPPNAGTSTWITTQGSDAESDSSLVTRCMARWPGLGGGATALVYQAAAIASSLTITKASVLPGNGIVTIYVAGPAGGSQSGDVALAQAAITAIQPLCVIATVLPASNVAVTVAGTYSGSTAPNSVSAALSSYAAGIGIGGTVVLSKLIQTIMEQTGVTNVSLSSPGADIMMGTNQVAQFGTSGLVGIGF